MHLSDKDIDYIDERINRIRTILVSQYYDDENDKWTAATSHMMYASLEEIKKFLITKE